MFSPSGNNNNNNPYHHQLALPFYPYSSPTHPLMSYGTDSNNILYHYYQHPLLAGQQLLPAGYVVPESATTAADIAALNNSITGVVATNALPEKPVKKDRHSKIYTAQGLRDRRVRLSTEISRQFFDLQDLLGYDKASETIAWLLRKSKKDIKQLVEMKTKCSPSSNQGAENGEQDGIVSQIESLTGTSIERKVKSKRAAAFQLLRKESRTTKAREINMCTAEKIHGLNQARSTGHFDVSEKSGSLRGFDEFGGKSTDSVAYNQLAREDIMGESNMITRKLKPVSSSLGYQHSFSGIPENWDMDGATSASSSYATSSMNLSTTEVLVPGKAWEACNSGCLE